jgi:hypothetical protein
LAFALGAQAQTNLQVFYDLGKDRKHVTTTMEGFYNDKWEILSSSLIMTIIQRRTRTIPMPLAARMGNRSLPELLAGHQACPSELHAEYNGGVYNGYTINNAWLFGLDYFIHNSDFRNTLNLKVLYKYIDYSNAGKNLDGSKKKSNVPMQFTVVWGMQDLFGLKGLRFSGFADFWWEDHTVAKVLSDRDKGYRDWSDSKDATVVFLSEPQLWYNVGRLFGVDNFNVGTEIELSYDFGSGKGFWVRPCLGAKWVF